MTEYPWTRIDHRTRKPLIGVNSITPVDYQPVSMFENVMQLSRDEFIDEGFTAFDGTVNSLGWPTDAGTASNWIGVIVAVNLDGDRPTGRFEVTWVGGAGVKPYLAFGSGAAGTLVEDNAQSRVYNITDWGGDVYFRIDAADINGEAGYSADPIRDVEICRESMAGTTMRGGANYFRQEFVDFFRPFKAVRVMDWLATNQKEGYTTHASQRPLNHRTFTHGGFDGGAGRQYQPGLPLTVVCEFLAAAECRGWFCVPHELPDAEVRLWAQELIAAYDFDNGPPGVEYSNETWHDPNFPQGTYMQTTGLAEDAATGRYGGSELFPLWYQSGFRAKQVLAIVKEEFDAAGKDFTPILCLQTGYTGRNINTLEANTSEPYDSGSTEKAIDFFVNGSIGITSYFGAKLVANRAQFDNTGGSRVLPGGTDPTRFGAGVKHTIDMTVEEVWDAAEYEITNFMTDAAENDTWAKNVSQIRALQAGIDIVGYECWHHMVRGGGVPVDTIVTDTVESYESARGVEVIKLGLKTFMEETGGTPMQFVPASQRVADDGHWGAWPSIMEAQTDPIDGTHPLGDMLKLLAGHTTVLSL